jgi:hypothetical protein
MIIKEKFMYLVFARLSLVSQTTKIHNFSDFTVCNTRRVIIINDDNLDWGPVPHFCPLEALQPVWLTPEVYCTNNK